jgi:Ca2+-binding RTX toxin-like protein
VEHSPALEAYGHAARTDTMTAITITADYTIGASETLNFADGSAFWFYPTGSDASLYNYGTVIVTSSTSEVTGASAAPVAGYSHSVFWNEAGATYSVTESSASGGMAYGFNSPSSAPDIHNSGTYSVTSVHGDAYGLRPQGSSKFTNDGIFTVSAGRSALGADLYWGGTYLNSGTMDISGGTRSAAILEELYNSQVINSGTIKSHVSPGGYGVGIDIRYMCTVDNSGLIEADTAIDASGWVSLSNTGTITGAIKAGGAYDVIQNSGTINGDIHLAGGNDTYDGTGGTLNGTVFGEAGNDTLAGGSGNDTMDGGDGFDTVSYANATGGVTVDLRLATPQAVGGGMGSDTLTSFEGIIGSAFADNLTGTDSADVLTGGAGNDVLAGGLGNDTLDGGLGLDTAVYAGNLSQYTITHNGDGSTTISGLADTDTLSHVERAQFSDQTVAIGQVAQKDFAGTGTSAILWQSAATGQYAIWQMNGTSVGSSGFTSVQPGPEWTIIGGGDFNDDGKADILWKNTTTNQKAVWFMNGTTVNGGGFTSIQAGSEWTILGTGDFNDNGKTDLLWKNGTTGQLAVWLMDGTTVTGGGFTSMQAGAEWSVLGTGDFNGDGKADILWKNTSTGQMAVWFMDGTAVTGGGFTSSQAGSEWSVLGTGDFNGDGKTDILWKNTNTGQMAVWLMNGTTVSGGGFTSSQAGSDWSLTGIGDYNGDGNADILWRNTNTGAPAIWFMNGTNVLAGSGFAGTNPGTNWSVIATAAG